MIKQNVKDAFIVYTAGIIAVVGVFVLGYSGAIIEDYAHIKEGQVKPDFMEYTNQEIQKFISNEYYTHYPDSTASDETIATDDILKNQTVDITNGSFVDITNGSFVDITTGDFIPGDYTVSILDPAIVVFYAGGKDGTVITNPVLEGIGIGSTQVELTNITTGEKTSFTVNVL